MSGSGESGIWDRNSREIQPMRRGSRCSKSQSQHTYGRRKYKKKTRVACHRQQGRGCRHKSSAPSVGQIHNCSGGCVQILPHWLKLTKINAVKEVCLKSGHPGTAHVPSRDVLSSNTKTTAHLRHGAAVQNMCVKSKYLGKVGERKYCIRPCTFRVSQTRHESALWLYAFAKRRWS